MKRHIQQKSPQTAKKKQQEQGMATSEINPRHIPSRKIPLFTETALRQLSIDVSSATTQQLATPQSVLPPIQINIQPVSPPPRLELLDRISGTSPTKTSQATPLSGHFFHSQSQQRRRQPSTPSSPYKPPAVNKTTFTVVSNTTPIPSPITTTESPLLYRIQQQREHIYLICLQHSLETTATLIETFINKGLSKQHIYFLDKLYSTHDRSWGKIKQLIGDESRIIRLTPPSEPWLYGSNMKKHINRLYKKVMEDISHQQEPPTKIILLDDGGRLIELLPQELLKYHVYGVEQTTAGHRRLTEKAPHCPWISIAASQLKRNEDPFIGELAAQRVRQLLSSSTTTAEPQNVRCGIIGLGHIGTAVAQELIAAGFDVSFYDSQSEITVTIPNLKKSANATELIKTNQFIIGCTGQDTLKGIDLTTAINEDKHFISVSSEAIEFKSLMVRYQRQIQNLDQYQQNPFTDLCYRINNYCIIFVNSGFPATFNHTQPHAVAAKKIAVTRAALFAGVMQWCYHRPTDEKLIEYREATPLNQDAQQYIQQEWRRTLQEETSAAPQVVI